MQTFEYAYRCVILSYVQNKNKFYITLTIFTKY